MSERGTWLISIKVREHTFHSRRCCRGERRLAVPYWLCVFSFLGGPCIVGVVISRRRPSWQTSLMPRRRLRRPGSDDAARRQFDQVLVALYLFFSLSFFCWVVCYFLVFKATHCVPPFFGVRWWRHRLVSCFFGLWISADVADSVFAW